jgi:hypothetical protein
MVNTYTLEILLGIELKWLNLFELIKLSLRRDLFLIAQ